MNETLASDSTAAAAEAEASEARRLREALEDLLVILGDPAGYCEDDRTEVAQAVAKIERALGRRAEPVWRPLPSRARSSQASS